MLNKIFLKIFGVLDLIKDFLIAWGLKILVVIFALMIMHNVIKISEISSRYQGDYKTLTPIYEDEKKFMNYYEVGEGPTVVILPEFGSQSPVTQYKTIVDSLKDSYRVVVVEYFGYGFSMSMSEHERLNDVIVEEVIKLLEYREIPGPYNLIAADTSAIYAMRFQQKYPELVSSIVSIDSVYPAEYNDYYRMDKIRDRVSNVNLTSIWELTGFERILSFVSPQTFYLDKMKSLKDNYSKEEISVYRNRIGSAYLTRTMVREINKLEENMKQMKDYTYPSHLPVLQILSTEKKGIYEYAKNSGDSKVNLVDLAQKTITNSSIQGINVIQGDEQMLQLSNPTSVNLAIRNFLAGYYDFDDISSNVTETSNEDETNTTSETSNVVNDNTVVDNSVNTNNTIANTTVTNTTVTNSTTTNTTVNASTNTTKSSGATNKSSSEVYTIEID